MLAILWPFGFPVRFADSGVGQTRFAQTLPAFSPVSVALLGHATRPGEPSAGERTNLRCSDKARQFIEVSTQGAGRRALVRVEEKREVPMESVSLKQCSLLFRRWEGIRSLLIG